MLKSSTILLMVVLSGCSCLKHKPCYEMTTSFNGEPTKQVICTNQQVRESDKFRKISK